MWGSGNRGGECACWTPAGVIEDAMRGDARRPCDYPARIASADRVVSTAGRIVNISDIAARVEVMFPRRGPSMIMLHDLFNDHIYECEVRWRTDEFIGVRFIDVLGSGRRRRYLEGADVRLVKTQRRIIELASPPHENVLSGPSPSRLGAMRKIETDKILTPPPGARGRLRNIRLVRKGIL